MLIKKARAVRPLEITDEQTYFRRREFIKAAGGLAIAAAASPLLACSGEAATEAPMPGGLAPQSPLSGYRRKVGATDEKLNTFEDTTSDTNAYGPWELLASPQRDAWRRKTTPWTVKID